MAPEVVPTRKPSRSLLGSRAGMLLDWSEVDKAMLLAAVPLPLLVASIVRVQILLADPTDEPYLSRPTLGALRWVIAFYAGAVMLLAAFWPWLRKRRPDGPMFVTACLMLLFATTSIAAYIVGHFSTPILGGCVAASIAVLLLFERRVAWPAVVVGALSLFGPIPLIALRIIPYAPLYNASPFIGPTPNLTWLVTTMLFGVVILVTPVSILMAVLDRWRVHDTEIHRLARLDGLTEVPNRRYFNERLDAELSRVRRHGSEVSLLILDLDHFKRVNDRFGHQVGDRVLVQVARLMGGDMLRKIDVVGRYGGEEFAVMLPETDLAGAKIVAERIRRAVEMSVVHLDDGQVVRMTTSIGIAVTDRHELGTLDALVRHADGALYRAKENGRNRVEHEPLEERSSVS